MRCFIFFVIGFSFWFLSGQNVVNKAFIFDPVIKKQYNTAFDKIVNVMADYYEGVEYSNPEKLASSFHDTWQMRDNDGTKNQYIHIEDKSTFITRVRDHGNYEDYASQRKIEAVEIIHDQLAFVRIGRSATRNATLFFLAKMDGNWKIIDKLWVYKEANFNSLPTEELLRSINDFRKSGITDKDFDSIVLSANTYKTSKTSQLVDHEIKLTSVFTLYDRLAIVRTDYPALNTTGFIVLFRLDDGWKVACERVSLKA